MSPRNGTTMGPMGDAHTPMLRLWHIITTMFGAFFLSISRFFGQLFLGLDTSGSRETPISLNQGIYLKVE